MNLLVDDSTVDAFPFPLDRELIGSGEYVQPSEDEGYVYAVVPYRWEDLSKLSYTVIDTCCIPADNDSILLGVEEQALKNAGFQMDSVQRQSRSVAGVIQVKNTQTQRYEGVRGLKVVMNTLVRVRHAYTGEDGSYHRGTRFLTKVNYTLSYRNHDNFMIWKNNLSVLPATLCLGAQNATGYSYSMDTTSHGWQLSTVHNATYIYRNYLCDTFHLDRPPKGMRIWLMPTDLSGDWTACTPMWHHRIFDYLTFESFMDLFPISVTVVYLWVLPDMFVFRNDRSTVDHYRTIFHELSHASHCVHAGANYWGHLVWNTIIHGGYGDSISRPDYVGVGEMWAYYADTRMINAVFENESGFPVHITHRSEWFRPGILDTIENNIPGMNPGFIFQCLKSTNNTHLTMRDEIKQRVNNDVYYEMIDGWFAPVIGE